MDIEKNTFMSNARVHAQVALEVKGTQGKVLDIRLKDNSACWNNTQGENNAWRLCKCEGAITVNENNVLAEYRDCIPEKGIGFYRKTEEELKEEKTENQEPPGQEESTYE
jgi:hypothetical protein